MIKMGESTPARRIVNAAFPETTRQLRLADLKSRMGDQQGKLSQMRDGDAEPNERPAVALGCNPASPEPFPPIQSLPIPAA